MKPVHLSNDYKQSNELFRIKGLNTPWREVMHLGISRSIPKFYEFSKDKDDFFYLLTEGSLRLSGLASNGKERVIMYMESDCIFGEVVHIHRSHIHSFSILTTERCKIVCFPTSLLEDKTFGSQYPHLMLNLVRSIGIKAGAFFCQISDSTLLESKTQICRMVYQLWKENGERESFKPGVSQSDMADVLGLHRSSLTRTLSELRDEGVIGNFRKTNLEILDPKKLMEFADVISINDVL